MDTFELLTNAHNQYAEALTRHQDALELVHEAQHDLDLVVHKTVIEQFDVLTSARNEREYKLRYAKYIDGNEAVTEARAAFVDAQIYATETEANKKVAYDWTLMARTFVNSLSQQGTITTGDLNGNPRAE